MLVFAFSLLLLCSTAVSACSPGSYDSKSGCHLCPSGTFAPNANMETCITCPPGLVSEGLGATFCYKCPDGHTPFGVTMCIPCPAGMVTASNGTCYACPAGTRSDPLTNQCVECNPGEFSPAAGQTECQFCPPGSRSVRPGSTSCELCPINSFSAVNGSSSCEVCPDSTGTVAPGAVVCKPNANLCQDRRPSNTIQAFNYIFFISVAIISASAAIYISYKSPSRHG